MQETKKRDWVDYAQLIATIITTVALPIVLLIVGNRFTASQNENQHKVKYTEIAISILSQKPTDDNIGLRSWASDILNSQSPVPMTQKAKNELGKEVILLNAWYICKDGQTVREHRVCPEVQAQSNLRK